MSKLRLTRHHFGICHSTIRGWALAAAAMPMNVSINFHSRKVRDCVTGVVFHGDRVCRATTTKDKYLNQTRAAVADAAAAAMQPKTERKHHRIAAKNKYKQKQQPQQQQRQQQQRGNSAVLT